MAQIVDWRRAALAQLATPLSGAHREIAPGEDELRMQYLTNAEPLETETTRDALRRRLIDTREKEMWNGATLVGPHRDDLAFELDGRDLAGVRLARPAANRDPAFKLAELDLLTRLDGQPPLLLLDDVFSELDPDAARAPRAAHRRPAPGVRVDDHDRRPGPRACGGVHGLGSQPGSADEGQPMSPKRQMTRVGDMLPKVAADIGIEHQLRLARQMSAWERLVEEHVPAARGTSKLLAVQPPALVVSATDNSVGQELRLRQAELLDAFARVPDGVHLLELRVVVRPAGRAFDPR